MTLFADAATSFITQSPDATSRDRAWRAYLDEGLPTTKDEVWRYAPLNELDLEHYSVAREPRPGVDSPFADQLCSTAGLIVRVTDGFLDEPSETIEGVTVQATDTAECLNGEDRVDRYASDSFALLNAALAPATTLVRIAAGVHVARPIVIVHATNSSSSFVRTHVELGRGASATVVEYFEGGDDALVVPLSEYAVGDNASLQLVTYQRLSASAWHVARTTAFLDRDARMSQAVIGMGGHYDRSRNDAVLRGAGAQNELRTTFLGADSQVHDFRTHQLHVAPRSRSLLLSKGAVADESRSVYTGLIEIEKGATRTDARQTNHNLLLSPLAHADSVPNLEIRENDVMCAHASSVGPLDELQRWYLESRGVRRRDAERLMIQGFFNEMLVALPQDLAGLVEGDVTTALGALRVVAP